MFDDQVDAFERLIVQLKAIGTFVDTDTLVEMLYGQRPMTGPCFHLSFDDGFRNIYTNAFPVLQRHGVPGIFFVPSSLVAADPELARSYCLETTNYAGVIELVRWEELRQMQEAGIEIGSHTRTHSRFSAVSADPARLCDEIYGSKAELEDISVASAGSYPGLTAPIVMPTPFRWSRSPPLVTQPALALFAARSSLS